ncbi:hypothetical protein GCM10009623_32460 [Nocardioides aestuarii]|uniref:Uncharacterized protein n=1 Tax=Nocardioides aestuarii TaxID=252231 RepID=A0ABW4TP36_9ACTN
MATAALVAAGAGVAVASGSPPLTATGPTAVDGTDGTGVFRIGDRTVRQVRYDDRGTLRYTFELHNDGRLPLQVVGLASDQADPRLFDLTALTPVTVAGGEAEVVTLSLAMNGCEALSSRSGSFVGEVVVTTRRAGMIEDDVVVALPEEIHTGSPREAFCPRSTATSRPQG